jgi:cell wall-associated NlpC family hydrolase
MSDQGRSPSKLLVFALALPIVALVYATTFGARVWAALRPAVATFLGATVISSIYAETAYRKTPTPIRATAVVALSIALVAPSFSAPQSVAAADPVDAVINAAKQYVGKSFQIGAEGPKEFDCSGLVYRAFADAGELPRIGGMRLRAAGYEQYFVSRGRFSRDESTAERGDLVIYAGGEHIGIYLGGGKVISALINPWGVTIHSINGIHVPVTRILHVNWGGGDSGDPGPGGSGDPNNGGNNQGNNGGNNNGNNNGNGDSNAGNGLDAPAVAGGNTGNPDSGNTDNGNPGLNPGDGNTDVGNSLDAPTVAGGSSDNGNTDGASWNGANAVALGTMNMRLSADPDSRIIGWIGRGGTFKVVAQGTSPAGFVWFKVQTKSGKEGWVYSRWVKELS